MNLWDMFMNSVLVLGIAFVWFLIVIITIATVDSVRKNRKTK